MNKYEKEEENLKFLGTIIKWLIIVFGCTGIIASVTYGSGIGAFMLTCAILSGLGASISGVIYIDKRLNI